MFRSYHRYRHFRHNTGGVSYAPTQYAALNGIPKSATAGAGQKIAVIELGGAYSQSDLDKYFKSLGLTVKPVVQHLVAGATMVPDPEGADGEVMLDLCVTGAIAPGAELHAYFAPNTDAGFLAAINQAIADGMDVISISWGGPEDAWSSGVPQQFAAAFAKASAAGICVTVAAGDNGSTDGERGNHVDYPASDPSVISCGGTSLPSTSPRTEKVWNDGTAGGATGGGVSALFTRPAYQPAALLPSPATHRGVPDVGGLADPDTGWDVVVDGQAMVIGGTSAVAPFTAAFIAVLRAATGKKFGSLDFLGSLYGASGACFDVTNGNNGTYTAKSGYDLCTGFGVPQYAKFLALFSAVAPPAPTPPAPTPPTSPTPPAPPAPVPTTRLIQVTGLGVIVNIDGKTV